MKVTDVSDGREYEVPGADPNRALVAMFLTQVLHKRTPEVVTWEMVENYLPTYRDAIRPARIPQQDGTVKHFRQLWRFMVEESLIAE